MQQITVTFTRLFDVVRFDPPFLSRDRVRTAFGFEDRTGKHYGICVPGLPRLEPGMKVIALLERENDWSSLRGWLDLETGALVGIDPAEFPLIIFMGLIGIVSLVTFPLTHSWPHALIAVPGLMWCVYALRRELALRRALRALLTQTTSVRR
ncbi:hypothetical protein ACDA63_19255 [Uliginosibacterium sp. sgz301328]|uniref:hypothetical protein n=1 Tax=Uliginosibacterium sp. sgz301328 TaxID=3243764 RepID=UPI00359DA9AD